MPEGDTIFRTARSLGRALGGKPVTVFRSTYPLLTRFNDDTPLAGQTVERVEARGKWLLIHFSGGGTLATHMLMSGSWHIYRHGERWQQPRFNMRIVIENSDYIAVGFRVPVAEMHTAQSLARQTRIPCEQIDVLSADFNAAEAERRVQAHDSEEIADVLLHQGVLQRLVRANVLEDSGDTIVTYGGRRRRTTHESDPGASLWVYGRNGEPCRRCGEPIRRRIQGPDARVTFWCARCQPMPDGTNIDG